mgnify:FL=1|tara:strand:+ start:2463 stop:2801 length:339 start_codon:yes stop_codon:yes gene_type:complete
MFDDEIFEGKTLSNLFSEIYQNSQKKDEQINTLIGQLKGLIKNMTDATVIVPLIKDYIDASLKNDDHLIKMAGIIQRASQRAVTGGGDYSLSDDEKKQLIESIEEIEKNKET